MSEKRFVCIDVDYGDDWCITDNGKRLSEMEIVELLNEQQATIRRLQDLCGESDGENAKLPRFIVPKEKDDEFYWNIIDTQTGKVVLQHISLVQTRELCDLMNSLNVKSVKELMDNINENELLKKKIRGLEKENEQLRDYIDTIFEDNTHICNELDIEDVQFYCERNKDYRSPSCLYQKCFNEENLVELSEKIKELFDDE